MIFEIKIFETLRYPKNYRWIAKEQFLKNHNQIKLNLNS